MELPPDDGGLDLGDAPPLPDEVPDEGQELPGLPDDDNLGDVFGDHLADPEWLERNLADILVEDSSDHALIPVLPADDVGMDICEVCEAVALPDNLVRLTCTCQHKCVERVMQGAEPLVRHLRDEVRDKHILLELVKHAHLAAMSPGTRHMWKIAGRNVCTDAFIVLLGISRRRLGKIMKSVRTSGICPYSDLRSSNGGNGLHRDLRLGVDAFWHLCYHHVAEPLADADAKALREETVGSGARVLEYVAGTDGNPLAGATLDLYHNAGRRYMPPMTWAEVYQMYCLIADATPERGSLKLVQKVYKEYWEPTLGFRSVGQHARCATCARLAKTRRDSPDMAERAIADAEYKAHLNGVFAMRRVDMRFSQMSAASCEPGCTLPDRCLHIRIDGLDQAKGRCPRNLENSKQWSNLWRPQLHIVGVTVEGLFEQYWVMDQDVPKDSNMECTCLSLALDNAKNLLAQKGLRLPEFISIKYDNTGREGEKAARRQVDVMDPAQWHCSTSAGWMWRARALP